jgi:nitroreductase
MQLDDVLTSTGTCRYYTDEAVPDDVLARVLDAARWAPNGGNRQGVRFVVVRDEAKRQRLAELYLGPWKAYLSAATARCGAESMTQLFAAADHFAEHLADVPVIIVVCAEWSSIYPTDHQLGRISVVGGCSIYPAVQNLLLKAREEGLGTTLTTLLCSLEPDVKDLLAIPEGVITAAHVALGWPARPFPKRLSRRPLHEMAFLDTYGQALPGA